MTQKRVGLHILGDNRTPGHELHDTRRKGNEILRRSFDSLHIGKRDQVPPFFVFSKGPVGRDVIFRGLAVPGAQGTSALEDLVAIWKTSGGERFQNYKGIFTILDEPVISVEWLADLRDGKTIGHRTPKSWRAWMDSGVHNALAAPRTVAFRSREEQVPSDPNHVRIIELIVHYFRNHPRREYAFEGCAAEIAMMMDPNITECDVTRPWRDGGRDAIGNYRIGHQDHAIGVEFALEAKCKQLTSGSRIPETNRLISRLRYRQFGIFMTTSYVASQAYQEILEDGHPVVIVAGADIAKILVNTGYSTPDAVGLWLEESFPYEE